jgi:hypothetical protein
VHVVVDVIKQARTCAGSSAAMLQEFERWLYSGYSLRSLIEAPLISQEVLPETYVLLVIMAADAQARPLLQFHASCLFGTL